MRSPVTCEPAVSGAPSVLGGCPDDGSTLAISLDEALPAVVVELAGELDMVTAPQLSVALHDVARLGYRVVIVDLTAVEFMGSAGLNALVEARRLSGHDTSLRIVASTRKILRPLQVTGLDVLLNVFQSRADALA